MSKVLVDRDLLDSAATWLEWVHTPGGGCVEGSVAEDLRAILAQPAEAEGVKRWALDVDCLYPSNDGEWCEYGDHLAALSAERARADVAVADANDAERALVAVTAERDGLAAARMAYANEFAPDENGDPDVGNVHANIRALKTERDRLREQVKALQSDANSWQSGYDKGRNDGTKHRKSEIDQLRAEVEALRPDAERWSKCKAMPKAWWLEAMDEASRKGGRSLDEQIDAAVAAKEWRQ